MSAPPGSGDGAPFDDFRVEDEPMPDGRTIHYYVWPREEPSAEEAAAEAEPSAPAPAADV